MSQSTVLPVEELSSSRPVLVKSSQHNTTLLCIALISVVTLTYFSFYWNRFAGVRSGSGSFVSGNAFLSGLRPYRDYFTASTPLNILTSASVLRIFGNAPIVTRAFGVFERVVIGVLLVLWLQRLFRARSALAGGIVAIIVSAGDMADPIASYNHETMLWGIASGLFASLVINPSGPGWALPIYAVFSGIFAGLCFDSKQTIGLGITVGVPVVAFLCLWRLEGVRRAVAFLVAFLAGWVTMFGLLMIWLYDLGVLKDFFQQVFVQGPSAKAGHPSDFLIRFLHIAKARYIGAGIGALASLVFLKMLRTRGHEGIQERTMERGIPWIGAGAIAAIFCGAGAAYAGLPGFHLQTLSTAVIYFTFFGVTLSLAWFAWRWWRAELTVWSADAFLFMIVSFACASMLSLSFPVFEAMVLPGLGFLVATLLTRSSGWARTAVLAACFAVVAAQALLRLGMPFGFESFIEGPVRTADTKSKVERMRGLRLPSDTVRVIDTAVHIIKDHTRAGDTVFTYPEMGLIYGLSGRWPPTATLSQNIDVVNDKMARQEAATLLAHPPAVLVFLRESNDFLDWQDYLWRNGRKSGQRDIVAAVEKLASGYEVAARFDRPPIVIYIRREANSNLTGQ
jgi:hypothetical protein